MSERYTRRDAEEALERLAKLLGKSTRCIIAKPGKLKVVFGTWYVNYNPHYGGCVVKELCREQKGENAPFGDHRRTPRDFCQMVNDIERALQIKKESNQEKFHAINEVVFKFEVRK